MNVPYQVPSELLIPTPPLSNLSSKNAVRTNAKIREFRENREIGNEASYNLAQAEKYFERNMSNPYNTSRYVKETTPLFFTVSVTRLTDSTIL